MRLVAIAHPRSEPEAELLRTLLQDSGIFARVTGQYEMGGPIAVHVREEDVEAAQELIEGIEPPASGLDETRLVTLATYDSPLQAHAAAALLEEIGVPYRVIGEEAFGLGARVSLVVAEGAVLQAAEALRARSGSA